jgi:hypothetical protein
MDCRRAWLAIRGAAQNDGSIPSARAQARRTPTFRAAENSVRECAECGLCEVRRGLQPSKHRQSACRAEMMLIAIAAARRPTEDA